MPIATLRVAREDGVELHGSWPTSEMGSSDSTFIYPVLGGRADLGFLRVAGHGLGNCFYTYFHALVLAEKHGAAMLAPAWFSLKLGPLLRGERSKRFYLGMFRPSSGEIGGLKKLLWLAVPFRKRITVRVGESLEPAIVRGALNLVVSAKFTFRGLHEYRPVIRERLLGAVNHPLPRDHRWGDGRYIAVHVRLGDFAQVTDKTLVNMATDSSYRIPLSWYVNVMAALRKRYHGMPIHVFSDGREESLRPLLDQGASLYRSGSDITDLLAMSGASILVGSNSTYARWAAFLGDMPSVWLETINEVEKPSAPETPVAYVPIDCAEPELWE
jgi:hypothetical protein